jgi:ABC-type phosphate transport system substrate-binding protein
MLCCLPRPDAEAAPSGNRGNDDIALVMAAGPEPELPLTAGTLARIYLRKRQLWDDRSRIIAVNLPANHPLRRNFSAWVLGHSPEDLEWYWNDAYFHGVLPPTVLDSEEAVLRFVADTPGAIGYVSACAVDKRVVVVFRLPHPAGPHPCAH